MSTMLYYSVWISLKLYRGELIEILKDSTLQLKDRIAVFLINITTTQALTLVSCLALDKL